MNEGDALLIIAESTWTINLLHRLYRDRPNNLFKYYAYIPLLP